VKSEINWYYLAEISVPTLLGHDPTEQWIGRLAKDSLNVAQGQLIPGTQVAAAEADKRYPQNACEKLRRPANAKPAVCEHHLSGRPPVPDAVGFRRGWAA